MKKIRIYALHPACKDIVTMLEYFNLENLKSDFTFIWDEISPEYLVATEHIYIRTFYRKLFDKLYIKARVTIFYGGEAMSPNFNIFDYALSYDGYLQNGDRVAQLPSPLIFPGKAFLSNTHNDIMTLEDARRELNNKKKFCNFIYSNWNAHPNRDRLFYLLASYKRVDSLGRHLNNVKMKGTGYKGHAKECVVLKSEYKFSIASENAIFPGYTSEKIFTSLEAHTVPIYWGDPLIIKHVNPKCFINCNNFKSLDEVVSEVRKIDQDDELWCTMIAESWQTEKQIEYEENRNILYISFWKHIFEQDIIMAQRKPQGTHIYRYKDFFWNNAKPHRSFKLTLKTAQYLLKREVSELFGIIGS